MARILSSSLEVGGPPGAALCILGGTEGSVWYPYKVIIDYLYNDCINNVTFHKLHTSKSTNFLNTSGHIP